MRFTDSVAVTVHWIPLGAGGRVVARSGRLYELLYARRHRCPRRQLVHAALTVDHDGERWVVEQAPAWGNGPGDRGVVVNGPVGLRSLGRSALFRYEVRCWRSGVIDDLGSALADHVVAVADDVAALIVAAVADVPALTWGRRPPGTAEMWNSNSVAAWLLVTAGILAADDTDVPGLPAHCRAPGWGSGLDVARR
ncbi:hypothetical protein [Gordonia polyisoprenivorans]|jgi:hypothetical protein|uniref:hypothetical protein n=1 Tax=Gordonia polyisoprenivorans TaxID=84595 RepID=UPI001AD65684|nr:hypothetical protein [Gordonia polyisoprenivorans]QTI68483.1 hypothetical protein J6U32_23815 [Gordonia polyisoprenivorans]